MAGQFVIKQIAQEVISEVNQPLYIGGKLADGSDAKITVASNGNVSTATPLTVPSLTVNSQPVMSPLLAEYTVTGSPVTSIDFSGLDINTHKSYRVEIEYVNATASNSALRLAINGDTTATNYYNQFSQHDGSSTYNTRSNDNMCANAEVNNRAYIVLEIGLANGYAFSHITHNIFTGSTLIFVNRWLSKTASVANITQLTFIASVANSLAVGSRIRIYRQDV